MSIGTKATRPIVGSSASIRTNASQALTMIVVVVVGRGDGTLPRTEAPGEEVVP
jgi:hypothetical protein